MPYRVALLAVATATATAVAITLVPPIAGDGASATRIRPCHAAQVRLVVERQPINSAMTGFSIVATTSVKGLSCTVSGYPSVTLPKGDHGAVTLVMSPHLASRLAPGHVVVLSGSKAKSGGFYITNSWSCDPRSGEVIGRVRFGLASGDRVTGSAAMTFCKKREAVLELSPFVG
jgi:hypothetical protein